MPLISTYFGSAAVTSTLSEEPKQNRWRVLWRAPVIPKRNGTSCSALIVGSLMLTPTRHRGNLIQRWKVLQQHWRYQKEVLLHVQICSVHIYPLPKKSNTALGGARKSTGDTKTRWYYLFSTHCGIAHAHTNASPGKPITALQGAQRALVVPKRVATTCGIASAHTSLSPRNTNIALRDASKGIDDTMGYQTGILLPVQLSFWNR